MQKTTKEENEIPEHRQGRERWGRSVWKKEVIVMDHDECGDNLHCHYGEILFFFLFPARSKEGVIVTLQKQCIFNIHTRIAFSGRKRCCKFISLRVARVNVTSR